MLSEPRERDTRLGCLVAMVSAGFVILAFVGGWVVAVSLFWWIT